MCGRYTLTRPDELGDALAEILGERPPADPAIAALPPRFNVAPTQPVPVLLNRPDRGLALLRWGLVPHWAKDLSIGSRMINARAETVATQPAYRDLLPRRRCLVPADGFYERRTEGKRRQPYWFRREPRGLFCFAGLWSRWRPRDGEPIESFTIITAPAAPAVAPYHDRSPVIVAPADRARWLSEGPLRREELDDILAPTDLALVAIAVNPVVGSPAVDGPECLEPPTQVAMPSGQPGGR